MQVNQNERLKELIASFVLTYNYWGYLFSRILRVSDSSIPSIMGVSVNDNNNVSLKFNPELVDGTDNNTLIWILEHEGMHLLNSHLPRLIRMVADEVDNKKHNHKIELWNIAADCCVNSQIDKFPSSLKNSNEKVSPSSNKVFNFLVNSVRVIKSYRKKFENKKQNISIIKDFPVPRPPIITFSSLLKKNF